MLYKICSILLEKGFQRECKKLGVTVHAVRTVDYVSLMQQQNIKVSWNDVCLPFSRPFVNGPSIAAITLRPCV